MIVAYYRRVFFMFEKLIMGNDIMKNKYIDIILINFTTNGT